MQILFISWWWPYPANNGSKIRISSLLRQLAALHEVTLLSFAEANEATPDQIAHMRQLCRHVEVLPKPSYRPSSLKSTLGYVSRWPRSLADVYSPAMADLVTKHARDCDAIIASEFQTLRYLELAPQIPGILEDIELTGFHDRVTHAASAAARFRAGLTLFKLENALRRLFQQGVAMTAVSQEEKTFLEPLNPAHNPIRVIPNGVDTHAQQPNPAIQPRPLRLIYPGAVTYQANYDAVAYFIRDVLPLLRQRHPEIQFVVTGGTGSVDIRDLAAQPGVIFTGYLPEIASAIQESWATVVPLRHGSGTRLKILESMALGTPVISTSKGAEGLRVSDGENILLADDPAALADAVDRLHHNADLRSHLARAGRSLVELEYDWSIIGNQLVDLVETVVRQRISLHA
jgi:glycosyltransferase involved in cell wall biosynthesis